MTLSIRASEGDWGGAEVSNVEAVARSAATRFAAYGDDESVAILVEPTPSDGDPPMALSATSPSGGEFVVRLNVRHINCECACGWERLRQVQFERRKGATAVFQQDYPGDAARVICPDCNVQATSAPRAHADLVDRRRLRIRRVGMQQLDRQRRIVALNACDCRRRTARTAELAWRND